MSDRQTTPIKKALTDWRQTVDAAIKNLQQRPVGSPNGLIVPGGATGTWLTLPANGLVWNGGGGGGFGPLAYTMDADGFVHLRGLAQTLAASTPAVPSLVATIPIGYRPAFNVPVAVWLGNNGGNRSTGALIIGANGVINLESTGGLAGSLFFLDLSGVSPFYAGGQ